jgi:hypothetical protein
VIGELISREELSADDVREMYSLFSNYFEDVTERRFRTDLDEKQWIIRFTRGNALCGFSSLRFTRHVHCGKSTAVLSSGDTIMAPEARTTTVLARTWIKAVNQLRGFYGEPDLVWLLLVSGFRTYRLLPVFWREFYPRYNGLTPASVQEEMHSVASTLFGAQYWPKEGVVRFQEPQVLKPAYSGVPAARLDDPHVNFFISRNPLHSKGDELVCWARLSHENLTEAGARMWHATPGGQRKERSRACMPPA